MTAATPALALTLNRWIGTTADWHTASNWETGVPTSDSQILFGFSPYQTFPNDPDIGATDAECGKLEMAGDYYSPITFSGTATLTNYADLGSYQDDMTVNCPLNMQSGAPRLLANAGTTLAIMNGLTLTGASAVVAGTNQKVNDPAGTVKLAAACSGTADWYVYGGTLLVTNPSGSATGSGTIFLYHGDTLYATLAGTGCVGTGAHNLDNYGTIDPGDGAIGILTANVGAAQFYDSSVLNIRASGAEISKLVVSGNLVLNQGTDDSTLTVDGTMTAAGTCITYGGTLTGTFANTDLPTDYWVDYSVPGQVSVVPPGVPSAPSSLTATAISNSRIDLVWTDNSDNETGFKIERKTGAEGTWGQIDTVGEGVTTYQNTGLDPETEYYYRVRAYNAAGDSVPSPEANATTLVAAVPAAPSNLIALAASSTQINLEWTDNSNNEHGFKIERKTGEQGEWGQIDTVGVNVTTYSDTDLDPSTLYYYRVRAYNDVGDSDYSNEAYATTQTPGIPAAPSDLTATAVSSGQIDLEWTDNSDNEIGFKIDRKTGAEGTWGPLDTVGEDVTTYEDTGLPASTTFYYRVRAYNAVGDSDYSFEAYDTTWAPTYNFWRGTTADWHDADNWVDYIPDSDRDALMNIGHPASPFNPDINYDPDIGATDATCQTLDIAGDPYEWTLSGTGTLSVYGNIGASVAGTQTIDCPLYIRDGYYPRVFAASGTTLVITQGLNTSGPVQGIVTTVETVGTPGGILKIPAASTNPAFYDVRGGTLMATNTTGSATGSNYVQLYDGGTLAGNGIVGDGGNNVRNSGTINPGSGNFGDIATLTCNVTGVTFYDGSALHLQSDGTNISKLAITGTGDLDLNYNNTIEIEGAITNNGVCITYTGTRTGEFTNLLPVGYFSVDYGTAGQVKIVSLVPPGAPTAPSNLTATTVSYDKIDLAWTDNSDNEDGFKIERKTTGAWAQIDTVGEGVTTYNDTGLDPETTYYYRVRAYNAAGDSVYTNKASATTDAVPTIPITINAPYGISYSLAPIDIIFSTTTGAYQIYDINKTLVAEGTTTLNPQTISFTPPNYSWYLIVFAGEAKFMGVTPAFANMNTLDWGEMDDTRGNNNEPLQAFCGLMLDRTNTERTFAQAHAIMDLADLYGVTLLTQFTNVGDITTENVTAWVTEMQGKVKYWEIINEPNLFISVNDYVTLLQLAYSIIKDIDPAAIVMGPDTCSVDLPWNEAFMEAGGGNYIDAYSIHDYEG
ncbi:MAG: fibronectin type III domain-containing protein, partial [Phycisphaerae bacterium]